MIELKQVVKRYHTKKKDVLAVDHVDLNIPTGSGLRCDWIFWRR